MNPVILEFKNISKAFFGIHALQDVSLCVQQEHILGLIGQNGAGKSTLMNILGGVLRADSGEMLLNGAVYTPRKPADASKLGVAFIHQELNLFTNLSIADNLFLERFPRRSYLPFIDRRFIHKRSEEILQSIGLDLSPSLLIDKLSPGERQLVEIAKALSLDANIIIFDEPTTSLTARETEQLFGIINQLRAEGKTIIYISHILRDVLEIADDIAVLRDGQLIGTGPHEEFTTNLMISMMVGRNLEQLYPTRISQPSDDIVLDVQNISQPGIVDAISFSLHKGEILGIFGLMGSGRTELARILFGLDEYKEGKICLDGQPCKRASAQNSIRNQVAFVTENRRTEGLLMDISIADNISLVSLPEFTQRWIPVVRQDEVNAAASEVASSLQLKASDIFTQPAKSLSGGNQQKVVIAKWLVSNPSIFIVDEPTRGIDVGAKYEIYSIINNLAAQGTGVLFISSELEELMGMCDRILVMSRGELRGKFNCSEFNAENILRSAFREENGI